MEETTMEATTGDGEVAMKVGYGRSCNGGNGQR